MDIVEILDRYAEGDEFQRPIETAIEEITALRQRVQELESLRKENKQLQTSFDAQCVSADKLFDECAELRQRVVELEKDCDEYHQVAMHHIHANEKLTAERDSAYKIADHYRAERDKATQYWQIAEGRCDALMKQRDELLKALEEMIEYVDVPDFDGAPSEASVTKARAAIDSVKEKS